MSQSTHQITTDPHASQQVEGELLQAGFTMPLFHRVAWTSRNPNRTYKCVSVHASDGRPLAQVAVQFDVSRVLPGHSFLRVLRFGGNLPDEAVEPMVFALKDLASKDKGTLRLSIGVFARERRAVIASALEHHGFQKAPEPQSYRHTLAIDLHPSEADLLAGLHKTTRRKLRDTEKAALHVTALTDPRYADRIAHLQGETLSRTGGDIELPDWPSVLDLSGRHPELSRIVGLFESAEDLAPEKILGFAWGAMHGDNVDYRAAGMTRMEGRNISIGYPLMWALILWAKQEGAQWFDMGGVTLVGTPDDPLAGISDFKRMFSQVTEEVGEEWFLEPHPAKTRMASLLGQAGRQAAGLLDRMRGGKVGV